MKKPDLKDVVLALLMLVTAYWLTTKISKLARLKNIFASEKVVIDQTPIFIKNIRSIAQLVTITTYDEVVVDSMVYNRTTAFLDAFRTVAPLAVLPSRQKRLVIIGKGKVMAGIDLKQLTAGNLRISGDTAVLQLPSASIIDVVMNPSDFETFEEQGNWSPEEVTGVKVKARDKLLQRALQQNILAKSTKKAKGIMQQLLLSSGFKIAIVQTIKSQR